MELSSISSTPRTPSAGASSSTDALSSFGKNFDNFLTLLTAQLRNQDPVSPLNPTEFTTQLVQFTAVEQAIRQNKNLEELIALQKTSQSAAMVGYVGKTIEAKGSSVFLSEGKAEFTYRLDGAAAKTTITITDSSGKLVRSAIGQTAKGLHSFVWDGRNDGSVPVPDGTYKVAVTATDGAGKPISTTTSIVGKVSGVTTANGSTALTVNGLKIPLSDVVSVRTDSST